MSFPLPRLFRFLFFLLVMAVCGVHAQTVLVPKGAVWKYFDGNQMPAAGWMNSGFSDAAWASGPAQLGYGDGDESTVISFGPDPSNKYITSYYRATFSLADTTGMPALTGSALFDDGVAVYVNGQEIYRNNLPAGQLDFSTLASGLINEGQYFGFSVPVRYLKPGANVIAAEVHQNNGTSSDVSFDLELKEPAAAAVFSSNLPLILIDVPGTIPDEPKATANMKIIYNGAGQTTRSTDPPTDYNGFIGIERRGSTSQDLSTKKPYAVELRDASGLELDTALLGMPREHDWILLAPFSDKTLVREAFIYGIGRKMMTYAPRMRFVELIINNEYQGVYLLAEKIKRDPGRVNISKLLPTENTGDDLTGGYIIKIDKTTGGNVPDGWLAEAYIPKNYYQYHYPAADAITDAQRTYIRGFITNFEAMMAGPDFNHPTLGYSSWIDTDTFVDYLIINELSRNVDGYRLSTYLYKDKDSKDPRLKMGPIWDYNITLGNADYCEGGLTTGFAYDFNLVCGGEYGGVPFWWSRLLEDPEFRLKVGNRWASLRTGLLSDVSLFQRIDSMVSLLQQPAQRNFEKYPILGTYVWPNSFVGGSYSAEVAYLKNWISERTAFLDQAFEAFRDIPYESYRYTPPLVYPNPSAGEVQFKYYVHDYDDVVIDIRNASGQLIYRLEDRENNNGWNSMSWTWPEWAAPGLYFYSVRAGQKVLSSGRMVRK